MAACARGRGGRVARRLLQRGVRVDEALPIYSGGLGVLSGDHLKSASELGLPLVGVGLLYRGGYFAGLDEAGRQTENYQAVDAEAAGLVREPVTVEGAAARSRVPVRLDVESCRFPDPVEVAA